MTTDLIRVFGRIGLLSFGGPAAQIALMHKELVEDRDWLSEDEFLRALSFCMLLPGPEAMQLATYAGWKRQGVIGGLIGGGLFVLPGALVIFALASLYGAYGNLPVITALFLGVKATVVIVVIAALIKISKRALTASRHRWVALAAFVALFFFAIPFPLVIGLAAITGAWGITAKAAPAPLPKAQMWNALRVFALGGLLWATPIGFLLATNQSFLTQVGLFFSTLAVVTFGGAYAVLAYMTQEVVVSFGWLSTAQMLDALGLAESTPGPLILVTQFVAMIAGLARGGASLAIAAGLLTLWVTFVPCFIWIFAGAPLIDWLAGRPRLQAALAGITAAVVGVIANLSLWFALHVFFADVTPWHWGPLSSIAPQITSIDPISILLAAASAAMLLWRGWPLPLVLFISAILGFLASFLPGGV